MQTQIFIIILTFLVLLMGSCIPVEKLDSRVWDAGYLDPNLAGNWKSAESPFPYSADYITFTEEDSSYRLSMRDTRSSNQELIGNLRMNVRSCRAGQTRFLVIRGIKQSIQEAAAMDESGPVEASASTDPSSDSLDAILSRTDNVILRYTVQENLLTCYDLKAGVLSRLIADGKLQGEVFPDADLVEARLLQIDPNGLNVLSEQEHWRPVRSYKRIGSVEEDIARTMVVEKKKGDKKGVHPGSGCKIGAPTEPSQPKAMVGKTGAEMVPLQLDLPGEFPFIDCSHQVNLEEIKNLEPDTPRVPFLVPQGVKNLAMNKSVTSSQSEPIIGTLDMIVDGDKGMLEESLVELGPSAQWIMIDLEKEYDLYAIVFWHYYKNTRVYCYVVVQVSNDPEFNKDVTTLFNNDLDNSLGLGIGQDMLYIDRAEGKLVDAKATKGRYVKLWSNGDSRPNEFSHYIEVEVYGK